MDDDKREEHVALLVSMGFGEDSARHTLAFADGSLETAITLLLSGQGIDRPLAPEAVPEPLPPLPHPLAQSTLIKPYRAYASSRCGYCEGISTAHHYAFTALRIRPEHYGLLLDQWCLSGRWMYHPLAFKSCCRLYSIRLPVSKWDPSETHAAQVRDKMSRFLQQPAKRQKKLPAPADPLVDELGFIVKSVLKLHVPEEKVPGTIYIRAPKPDAKDRRYSMPLQPLVHRLGAEDVDQETLFKWFVASWPNGTLELVKGHAVFQAYAKPRDEKPPPVDGASPREIRHLDVQIEEAGFSQEKYALWVRYEKFVHKNDDCDDATFRRVYCTSPVIRVPPSEQYPLGLGPVHHTYRLDGELVGCALLLILPDTVCSIYFWWDKEALAASSLGHYSQLVELQLIRSRLEHVQYYNLVWHCPTSSKMEYKMRYAGTEICCPETLTWIEYTPKIKARIESGYGRLVDDDSIPVAHVEQPDRVKFEYRIRLGEDLVLDYAVARQYLQGNLETFEQQLRELSMYLPASLRPYFVISLTHQ